MYLAVSWDMYTGLPQRIPMHLLYTMNVPVSCTIYRVTSAYTNASALCSECTSFSWTMLKYPKRTYTNLQVTSWGVATPQRPKNCDNSKTTVDKNLKFFDFYYMTVL